MRSSWVDLVANEEDFSQGDVSGLFGLYLSNRLLAVFPQFYIMVNDVVGVPAKLDPCGICALVFAGRP